MKRIKTAKMIVFLLASCLLLTACPPDGGDLVPLAQGEGASLATTKFNDDTLAITQSRVRLAARGLWSVADSATSVILEIVNANPEPLIVDFARCELVNNESKEKLVLRSLSDETAKSGPAFLAEKTLTINGGEEKKIALEFKLDPGNGRSSVSRNVLGQTITLRLPVMLKAERAGGGVDENERPAQVDFVLTFKYAGYQGQR